MGIARQRPQQPTFTGTVRADPAEIKRLLDSIPWAVTARYKSFSLNPTIRLGWVNLRIRVKERTETKSALVSLVCQPRPEIIFETPGGVSPELFFASFGGDSRVEVIDTGVVPPLPRKRLPPSRSSFTGYFPPTTFGSGGDLYRAGFSVFNFPDVIGPVVKTKRGSRQSTTAGRIALKSDDWFVILDPTHDLREQHQLARKRGANFMSHAGVLGRSDDRAFTDDELQNLLFALYWLFAFALGRRTGPVLPYAIRQGSERPKWTQWALRSVDPVGPRATWYDHHHPESLNEIFGSFCRIWNVPRYRNVLETAIGWYVQAHDADPIENAIVAAHIALERLASNSPLRPQTTDLTLGKGAAGRLANLLKTARVPLDIPAELIDLQRVANWKHGPDATTALRNDIAHPSKEHNWTQPAMVDAWRLSLWYLELVLLAWLGYRGVYNRRTRTDRWMGLVDPVPWVV